MIEERVGFLLVFQTIRDDISELRTFCKVRIIEDDITTDLKINIINRYEIEKNLKLNY